MKELKHLNTCNLHKYFYSHDDKKKKNLYLHCVMDYIPETLYRIIRYYRKIHTPFPEILLKIYTYQMFRALAYIHGKGITHRDIKPQNVLIDPQTHLLKLCDFGSAKKIQKGQPNIAYICSRYYRAPELIFGATEYGPAIDVWSTGCIVGEMVLGEPLFPGNSSLHQLVQIIKILGTPRNEQIQDMNPENMDTKLPQLKPADWKSKVFFKFKVKKDYIDLLSKMLEYSPKKRITPLKGLLHPFFDDLRAKNCKINGRQIPDLFDFTKEELSEDPSLFSQLVPEWYVKKKKRQQQKTATEDA